MNTQRKIRQKRTCLIVTSREWEMGLLQKERRYVSFSRTVVYRVVEERTIETQVRTEQAREWEVAWRLEAIVEVGRRPCEQFRRSWEKPDWVNDSGELFWTRKKVNKAVRGQKELESVEFIECTFPAKGVGEGYYTVIIYKLFKC